MSPTHQDLSNDTPFSQIKSRVPVPLSQIFEIILSNTENPEKVKVTVLTGGRGAGG